MLVPRQHPLGFGDFYILVIDLPNDLWRTVFRYASKFVEKIHDV